MPDARKNALFWFVAAAIPFQGLPASLCACSLTDLSGSPTRQFSAESNSSCCSAKSTGHGCCSCQRRHTCCGNSTCDCRQCTCGVFCPCRHGKQVPPTAPPTGQRSLEKIDHLALSPASTAVVAPGLESQRSGSTLSACHTSRGIDCCISLCRFML